MRKFLVLLIIGIVLYWLFSGKGKEGSDGQDGSDSNSSVDPNSHYSSNIESEEASSVEDSDGWGDEDVNEPRSHVSAPASASRRENTNEVNIGNNYTPPSVVSPPVIIEPPKLPDFNNTFRPNFQPVIPPFQPHFQPPTFKYRVR